MSGYCKFYKQKKQVSYDNGVTWSDVTPYEYRVGDLYESASTDCGYVGDVERWVNSGTTCDGYDKYYIQVKQTSTDGINWTTTSDTQLGQLIERNSTDCGFIPTPTIATITYSASTKLTETTSADWRGSGLHINSFSGASGQQLTITDHSFSNGVGTVTFDNNIKRVGNYAFKGSTALTSVDIPSGVTTIGYYAFMNCSSLTSIVLPDTVTLIGEGLFESCGSLTNINIPSGITAITEQLFVECTSLTAITIPSGVKVIDDNAFYYCTSLYDITIPSGVTFIGEYAFQECRGLTSITVNAATPPTLGMQAFDSTNDCPIYVPAASVNAYKTATNWSDYASRIQAIT